mmetsp:Transcript_47384/g.135594  ORF Transcript_47384/g.135594 Transcript_47384/m.135594 type:complete len:232 (-) Transcript_47384:58-753(-)
MRDCENKGRYTNVLPPWIREPPRDPAVTTSPAIAGAGQTHASLQGSATMPSGTPFLQRDAGKPPRWQESALAPPRPKPHAWLGHSRRSDALAPQAARKLQVLWHDGDALGVDGAEVGVLEQADQVRLCRLLQGQHGLRLKLEVRLEVLRNLADEALEGQLADQQLRALLVFADLAERHGSWPVPKRLLDAALHGRLLARLLCSQRLAGRLAADGLAGGLLGAGHGSARGGH